MAGLPASSPSTSHDIVEIIKIIQRVGCCLDLSVQNYELSDKKLRSYFARVLAVFRSEIEQPMNIRPDPVWLGDGRAVDLSKLYFVVHEKGCYESVTVDKGWGSVSETLGFDPSLGSCLKLVYAKYLGGVEKWFRKLLVNNKEAAKEVHEFAVEVNGLDLAEDEAKGTSAKGTPVSDAKKSHFLTSCRDMKRRLEIDHNEKCGKDIMVIETKMGEQSYSKKRKRDDDQCGKDVMVIETKRADQSPIKKWKRDALGEMVDWLKNFARSPLNFCDDKMSSEGGKDNGRDMVSQFHSKLLSARELRLCKRIQLMNGTTENPILQKHQKVHPSIYDDDMDFDKSEKLRQSERIQSGNKQLYPSFHSQSPSVPANGIYNPVDKSKKSNPLLDIMANLQQTEYKYQPVPISSKFQAKLPQLMDKSLYADDTHSSKWLGTQIWPQENQKLEQFKHHHHPIGKGRVNNCKCKNHGSIECTRFHIAEKRYKLKSELGTAFYQWRFDRMGEEVALSWTKEESKIFKDVVQSYVTSPDRDLWKQLRLAFPLKKKKELVSYYFNVFTLSRRWYQNRVTPIEINSDDDEEFGFLSVRFGEDAMEGCESKANVCVQNTQCVYIDDD